MLSSRLNAFVIPMSQTTPMHRREDRIADDLDTHAGDEDERCRGSLGGELRERRQAVEIVEEAGEEDDAAAAENAAELGRGRR